MLNKCFLVFLLLLSFCLCKTPHQILPQRADCTFWNASLLISASSSVEELKHLGVCRHAVLSVTLQEASAKHVTGANYVSNSGFTTNLKSVFCRICAGHKPIKRLYWNFGAWIYHGIWKLFGTSSQNFFTTFNSKVSLLKL